MEIQPAYLLLLASYCCHLCSVIQSCPTLCNPMNCSTPGFSQSSLKLMSTELMMPSNHLILCHPLLLLLSIFPSIRVFSSGSALDIKWPKYWSFSFSISLSSEYSGLISFRMDWFDLPISPRLQLGIQGLQHHLKHRLGRDPVCDYWQDSVSKGLWA